MKQSAIAISNINLDLTFRHPVAAANRLPNPERPPEKVLTVCRGVYGTHFDSFMRHYLTVKTGQIPNINAVYDAFKEHARNSRADAVDDKSHIESLVREIRDYARHFCAMALGSEPDAQLRIAFQDLRELKVDVAYVIGLVRQSLELQLGNGGDA